MKVYIVTGEPFPHGLAGTQRIRNYAKAIIAGGLDCEVIIYKRTENVNSPFFNRERIGNIEGVPFRYLAKSPKRHKNPIFRRCCDYIDLTRTKRFLRKNLQPSDVLFFYMGAPYRIILDLMKIAHRNNAYCVRDLCELPYGTGKDSIKATRYRNIILQQQFPALDGVISISSALMNLAKSYTSQNCKHIKIPILVDYNNYSTNVSPNRYDKPFVFHSGTLYEQKDGIVGMLKAYVLARKHLKCPLQFISTGNIDNSPHKDEILNIIHSNQLQDDVSFLGILPQKKLHDYLLKATLVIINKYDTLQNHYCFSTKLGEYSAAAKPLIITDIGEASAYFEDGVSALVVPERNVEKMAQAIVSLIQNPSQCMAIGRNAQEVCLSNFDYNIWSEPLVSFFLSLDK